MCTSRPDEPWQTIARAFSMAAENYDRFGEDHPHHARMRDKVYDSLMRAVPAGARILELNSGSGTDAVYLAQRGYHIHATDIAPGMLQRLEQKIEQRRLEDHVTVQQCSFLSLEYIEGGPYDAVFSDLGGLNCAPDLAPIVEKLPLVLRPGGTLIWVVMPPICLWELLMVLAGQFRYAFRRLSPGGTIAHLEGNYFPVYYYTPEKVVRALGPQFKIASISGLSVITPTAESKNLAKHHRTLYGALAWLDDRLSPHWPWRGWGDFFIVSARYEP